MSWVHRRDFIQHIGGLTLGAGVAGLDIDRLLALLPQFEPTGTRHLGAADVEAIEQATSAFVRQDHAQGSGLTRDAARRLWLIGLNIARATDHPQGSDLTAYLLYDMAIQAVHLGRPDEALCLVHLGHATAAGTHPVSASTRCWLAKIQARAHAAQGDTTACQRALDQAAEQFSTVEPASSPPWGTHLSEAHLASTQGAAHYTMALTSPEHAAARALYLPDLTGAHAIAGDTDTAVTIGHQAIDAVTALRSPAPTTGSVS